jgi:hypothetical protein
MLGTSVALVGNHVRQTHLAGVATMIAHVSQFRSAPQSRLTLLRVRYDAPGDLLPWADPYIASLFASGEDESQAEIDTVVEYEDESSLEFRL